MKLAPGTPLSIALASKPGAPSPVGRVALDNGLAQLEWSPEVIGRGLAVAGLLYPPEPGLHPARSRSFEGLHGFLADSLPEGWGYRVMRRRLAKLGVDIATLTPLERLALVGDRGRGALTFAPTTAPEDEVSDLDLDALADEALMLLSGDDDGALTETLAGLAGGSGGARPKVHVGFGQDGSLSMGEGEVAPEHVPWIVKFRAPDDPIDAGPLEAAYAAMAKAAGLVMSEHQLIPARSGPGYFATRRFDRTANGGRRHMVSLAGAIEAPPNASAVGYDTFLRATRAITRRADDVRAAFRRMVFNILAHNRDDHTRQHAYLMDETGEWRLAPAYDLTYSHGPRGEHYLDIEGEGRDPSRDLVEALGARHGLDDRTITAVIEEVREAVAGWPAHAGAAGMSRATMDIVAAALEKVRAEFGG